MKVGITGAGGVVGSLVAEGLRAEHEVRGWDMKPGVQVDEVLDLVTAPSEQLEELFAGLDVLIHLAADARPPASDEEILRNNITLSTAIFRAAERVAVRRVIAASSGLTQEGLEPLEEGRLVTVEDPRAPTSLYAVSKCFIEDLATYFHISAGIETACIRIGTVLKDEQLYFRTSSKRLIATRLTHEDCVQFFSKCVASPRVRNHVFHVVSESPGRFVDIQPAIDILGFEPTLWTLDEASAT